MSHTTDEIATRDASEFSTSPELKFPPKPVTNSISKRIYNDSLNKKLKTIQTTPIYQGVYFSTGKESHETTLITKNKTDSTVLKSKSTKRIESTDASVTDPMKSADRNMNSRSDQFTKIMLQNDINSISNIKEFSSSLKRIKKRFTIISSLSTSPNIVASSLFRDNAGQMLESNNDLSTKTSLLKTERFTVPVKPIETSPTQTMPSESTMSPDKIRFLDSTMQSATTMKEDSTFRLQGSISIGTTMPLSMVTNRDSSSTFILKAPTIYTEKTQKPVSTGSSYKVQITTEEKLTSESLRKIPTKTLYRKKQMKMSSALQNLNTTSKVIQGDPNKKTTSHYLSSSRIPSRSTKHPVFILNPTHSSTFTNDLHLGNTTEPIQTMGAGVLVIVVLLPFLALFLIAVVTALRRKMRKTNRRGRRYKNPDVENKTDMDQSQMVPLTKSEVME